MDYLPGSLICPFVNNIMFSYEYCLFEMQIYNEDVLWQARDMHLLYDILFCINSLVRDSNGRNG